MNRFTLAAIGCVALLATAGRGFAADPSLLRIGTGGVAGTYYPVGSLIAAGLSEGSGPGACAGADKCGIPGVLSVAQISNGSVANVEGLQKNQIEAALAQSNVVDWAFRGHGPFAGNPRANHLRAVAALYPESLHIVVRAQAGIKSVADLRGRRVSLDELGSGTLEDAREVLRSFGVGETDFVPEYIKPDLAIARMAEGRLDAFFIVAGAPIASLVEASDRVAFSLVPIDGAGVDRLLARLPFYTRAVIPFGAYPAVPETETIAVNAQLIVREDLDENLVYAITEVLWSERLRKLLSDGHPRGRDIREDRALAGISIPLHPGAERFYRQRGLLK